MTNDTIKNERVRQLNTVTPVPGPVLYWMSRDQRADDNWALLYAQQLAREHNTTFEVVFCLRKRFAYATERLLRFMFAGLAEVEERLKEKNIPFHFLLGDPAEQLPAFVHKNSFGALVTDFSPLRYNRNWKQAIAEHLPVPLYEVDAHNIVPAWAASPKQEFGAYTLRPKLHRLLPYFLDEYPALEQQSRARPIPSIEWKRIYSQISIDTSVPEVRWLHPGSRAARGVLETFIDTRLEQYATDRNDPTKQAQSDLSPYLHFGHIAAQRVALEVGAVKMHGPSKSAYMEELIVRRELSDNYCYYNRDYDNPKGYPDWARKTLAEHARDRREYTYSLEELREAKTHDELWNAAQKEMVSRGKMHGYLRMYWAKKIFEWSGTVEEAHHNAIVLNDTYFLDGRDPNGYTGIAWSMGGVHDRAWFQKPVFGKIRYMSYNGAKGKFDVKKYISMQSAGS